VCGGNHGPKLPSFQELSCGLSPMLTADGASAANRKSQYTSEREKFVYENKDALALQGILPEYYEVKPSDTTSATITQVTRNDGKTFQLEDALKRADDKYLIMIKTVGYVKPTDMKKDEKIVMDIKIGAYTKSQMQFSEEGA
jgi:hypothetical protein